MTRPAELPACRCGIRPRETRPLAERLDDFGQIALMVMSA